MTKDARQGELIQWLSTVLDSSAPTLTPIPGDASFRRYFRLTHKGQKMLAVDSPPDKEDSHSFVAIDKVMELHGVHVPHIYANDFEQGFLLISDLGHDVYFSILNAQNADTLYCAALDELIRIHQIHEVSGWNVPPFDRSLMQYELNQFSEWYLQKYLKLQLSAKDKAMLQDMYDYLIQSAVDQPQVFVHRDYHSRNLLWVDQKTVGVIDFQDAVIGPVTYDAVSLLRDCYIDWPNESVQKWSRFVYEKLIHANVISNEIAFAQWSEWFDWMGMQRHLKAIFIFARKYLRDHDTNYLKDIDRALRYVQSVCDKTPVLAPFKTFLLEWILPAHMEVDLS